MISKTVFNLDMKNVVFDTLASVTIDMINNCFVLGIHAFVKNELHNLEF